MPTKGKHITEGKYEYIKTEDGFPAMRFRWGNCLFSGGDQVLVFARGGKFRIFDSDQFRATAKWGAKTPLGFGLILSLIHMAVSAATTKTEGTKGFVFAYSNPKGEYCFFQALASIEIVDEISASIPEENIIKP